MPANPQMIVLPFFVLHILFSVMNELKCLFLFIWKTAGKCKTEKVVG